MTVHAVKGAPFFTMGCKTHEMSYIYNEIILLTFMLIFALVLCMLGKGTVHIIVVSYIVNNYDFILFVKTASVM